MSEQHDNDGFEAFVQRESAAYNEPPGRAPRDEMWEVIAARRAATRGVASPDLAPAGSAWRVRRYAPWIGMAATLIVGVGIGRFVLRDRDGTSDAPAVATVPVVAPATRDRSQSDAPRATDLPAPTPAATRDAGPRRAATDRTAPAVRTVEANDASNGLGPADAPYSVASRQHLTRAEALIAVVAMSSEDALLDSLTGKWARDILTNTRLLLDSPAGDDPVRRRLLEDLETILVQLVQKSGRAAEDKAMIDRSLQRTQLLTRLRNGAAGT